MEELIEMSLCEDVLPAQMGTITTIKDANAEGFYYYSNYS